MRSRHSTSQRRPFGVRSAFVLSLFVFAVASANERETSARRELANAQGASQLGAYAKPGPYPVGVQTFVVVDASRDDVYAGGPRTLVTEVWYPAVEAARSKPATSFVEFFRGHDDAAKSFVEHFGGTLEETNRRFVCRAVRGAAQRAGRFPLLVFSHGNGGIRHQSVFQVEHLASHGYVVASPDHTGNAGVTVFADRVLPYKRGGSARNRSAIDRPADVSYLIDCFLGKTESALERFANAIDASAIGVLGHSFGGFTACRVAETDPRVKAAIPMTVALGSAPGATPIFVMLAGLDDTVKAAGNGLSSAYYHDCTGPRYLLNLERAGHFSFSDMDRIDPDFGDGIGDGFLSIDVAKRIINGYSTAFFEGYLRGDARARMLCSENVDPSELRLLAASASDSAKPPDRAPAGESPKLRVLIVTGRDVPAHDWRTTTAVTRERLEKSGRFEVVVSEEPAVLEASTLGSYDAIVVNLRNRLSETLSQAARRNVESFVEGGKGLVALHFALNAWEDWPEYRTMLGRYWVRRQDGKKVSGHGPAARFKVRVRTEPHPITRGLKDFEIEDELYARLQGDRPIDVLASAHSDWSGREEPLAWTSTAGKGRVVVIALGHDRKARETAGFAHLLCAGVEWAATNEVASRPEKDPR